MLFRLLLLRKLYEQMIAQARAELPNECCGLLAGRFEDDGKVARVLDCYPLVNLAASPREYLSEPKSMFEAVRGMDQKGLDILAVYHSHPTSAPIPSRTDLERNFSDRVVNFIISLTSEPATVRGWWLTATEFHEADWELIEM
jgi:[CysO sulfur-carrier protein]-S-L-cysteine hydrolase